ncbi:MAG: hypothetical protein ABEK50_17325, partial [bacterium]
PCATGPRPSPDPEPPPLGAMFCSIFEKRDGKLHLVSEATSVEDASDIKGGVTGPGIEFFYEPRTENYRETGWALSVPAFRDSMTPSIPKESIQTVFGYGASKEASPSKQSDPPPQQQPILRSAI